MLKVNSSGYKLDDEQIERINEKGNEMAVFTVFQGPAGRWFLDNYYGWQDDITQRFEVELLGRLYNNGVIK